MNTYPGGAEVATSIPSSTIAACGTTANDVVYQGGAEVATDIPSSTMAASGTNARRAPWHPVYRSTSDVDVAREAFKSTGKANMCTDADDTHVNDELGEYSPSTPCSPVDTYGWLDPEI